MDEVTYAAATFRAALHDLSHELYYKPTHFRELKKHYIRAAFDSDTTALAAAADLGLGAETDRFTSQLSAVMLLLPEVPAGEERAKLLDRWERVESTLNSRAKAVFGLLGPRRSAALLGQLIPELNALPPLELHSGQRHVGAKRTDGIFGQPDLILRHSSVVVSMEMKVRGGTGIATYDAQQHLKYLRLAAELRSQAGPGEIRTAHILLAPLSGRRVVKRPSVWTRGAVIDGGALTCEVDGLLSLLSENRKIEVQALGGPAWIAAAQDAMPTYVLDLVRFLEAADGVALGETAEEGELRRQVATIRRYGLPRPRA